MAESLTSEEINEIKEAFEIFDKDRDGYITADELASVVKSIGRDITKHELRKMIKECDMDKNGKIDFQEFIGLMTKHLKSTDYDENLRKAFKVFDKDGNGFITRDELKQAMNRLDPTLTDEDIEDMLIEADTNKDGLINYEGLG